MDDYNSYLEHSFVIPAIAVLIIFAMSSDVVFGIGYGLPWSEATILRDPSKVGSCKGRYWRGEW